MDYRKHPERQISHLLSIPVIYAMFIPFLLLDLAIEIYHRVCFWFYDLPYVKRSAYIRILDRQKLAYLPWYDKINCAYCGYASGLLRYCSAIVAETENYWCAVKHKPAPDFKEPGYQKDFIPYGDEAALKDFESAAHAEHRNIEPR